MTQKRKMITGFAMIALLAGGGVSTVMAQSYPGLTSAPQQRDSGSRNAAPQNQQGYGGLVPGVTAPAAPNRPQAQQPERPETSRAERREEYRQTPDREALQRRPAPVRTSDDLKQQSRFNEIKRRQDEDNIALGEVKLDPRAVEAMNAPLEMIEGMYPQEYSTMTFVNMKFDEINKLPENQQAAKLDELRHSLEALVDNNNAKLASPNAVFRRIGMRPEAIAERLQEAEAVNARLEPILDELKGQR